MNQDTNQISGVTQPVQPQPTSAGNLPVASQQQSVGQAQMEKPQPPPESFEPVSSVPPSPPVTPSIPPKEETPSSRPKTILYLLVVVVILITIVALTMIFLNFSKGGGGTENGKGVSPQEVNIPPPASQPTISLPVEDEETQTLSTQGTSDEIPEIEKDLQNTDFSNLDREVGSISSELGQP